MLLQLVLSYAGTVSGKEDALIKCVPLEAPGRSDLIRCKQLKMVPSLTGFPKQKPTLHYKHSIAGMQIMCSEETLTESILPQKYCWGKRACEEKVRFSHHLHEWGFCTSRKQYMVSESVVATHATQPHCADLRLQSA